MVRGGPGGRYHGHGARVAHLRLTDERGMFHARGQARSAGVAFLGEEASRAHRELRDVLGGHVGAGSVADIAASIDNRREVVGRGPVNGRDNVGGHAGVGNVVGVGRSATAARESKEDREPEGGERQAHELLVVHRSPRAQALEIRSLK